MASLGVQTAQPPPPPHPPHLRRPGEKRPKEPSSYATSGNAPNISASLNQSFSNLSINDTKSSSRIVTLQQTHNQKSDVIFRERNDSTLSKASDSSALDRFLTEYEPGVISITAQVHEELGKMVFAVRLSVKEIGTMEWKVMKTVDNILEFCDSIRGSGAGLSFPMPPAANVMLQNVIPVKPGTIGVVGQQNSGMSINSSAADGDEDKKKITSTSKSRHQKKKVNAGFTGGGLLKVVSSAFGLSARNVGKKLENVYPTVQEWFDAALETWQRHWHSKKSDEDGISLAFETFLCTTSLDPTIPRQLLRVVDQYVLSLNGSNINAITSQQQIGNRQREILISQATIREAQHSDSTITVEELKLRVLIYAWSEYEDNHGASPLISSPSNHENNDLLPFLYLDVQPKPGGAANQVLITWHTHPQLSTVKLNLIDTFSVPPTPRSIHHFHKTWQNFSDIIVRRAFEKVNKG